MKFRPQTTHGMCRRSVRHPRTRLTAALATALALAAAAGCKPEPAAPPPPTATAPASRPADTAPSTTQAATKPADPTYLDVVRAAHPALPTTQPLPIALEIRDAAHFVLTDPVHLDEQGQLWITRPDGVLPEQILKAGPSALSAGNEHVVRDRVRFVWWMPDRARDFMPHVIAASAADGRPELVLPARRVLIGGRADYAWHRARSWVDGQAQRLIVPTARGVSVFTFGTPRDASPVTEAHQDLTDIREAPATQPTTQPATAPGPSTRPASGPAEPSPSGEGDVTTTATTRPVTSTTAPATLPAPATQPAGGPKLGEPQFLFDPRGLIAWIPAEPDRPGSPGAARFLDGKWVGLTPAAGWPDRLLHLVPLRDGSVTQLVFKERAEGGEGGGGEGARPPGVKVTLAAVDAPRVDRKQIEALVDELSNEDRVARERAYQQLTQYGPGVWPILREFPADDLPPEAAARLRQLLRSQVTPMLGGMGLQGDQLRLVGRLRDGGALFYTDQGVTLPNPQSDEPVGHAPAWVAARPGRAVELLPGVLVFDADPARTRFEVVNDTWVVHNDAAGPKQFLGNSFRRLLRKEHAEYTHVVGMDRRGRWLFRKPADVARAAAAGDGYAPPTLIIDPTLPDFTPRLPAWTYADAETAGWDKDGWPAVVLGNLRMKLVEDRWAPLGKDDEVFTEPPAPPADVPPPTNTVPQSESPPATPVALPDPATAPAATQAMPATFPATAPSASPTTAPATRPAGLSAEQIAALGPPLLTDPAGQRYYDGVEALHVVRPDGTDARWTLPGTATGQKPVTLVRARDGRLFLFNQPGRVLRMKPTPAAAEPFALEATFTRDIPSGGDDVRRIWLDPAGRIVIAVDKKLTILFPDGFIPRPVRQLMAVPPDDED